MVRVGDLTIQDQAAVLPAAKTAYFTRDISITGTQAITGLGFKPASILFLAAIITSDSVSIASMNGGSGLGIFNSGEETADTWSVASHCIVMTTGIGIVGYGNVSSIDTDGFTITWAKSGSPTGTAGITYMAFK